MWLISGTLIATIIGWKVSGWTGALVATLAYSLPSSLLYYAMAAFFRSSRAELWRARVEQGLVPVAVGLVIAGSHSILHSGGRDQLMMIVAFAAGPIVFWRR